MPTLSRFRLPHLSPGEVASDLAKHTYFPLQDPTQKVKVEPAPSFWATLVRKSAMRVKLDTQITTQKLPYWPGEKETAAKSVHGRFDKAWELMAANPSSASF